MLTGGINLPVLYGKADINPDFALTTSSFYYPQAFASPLHAYLIFLSLLYRVSLIHYGEVGFVLLKAGSNREVIFLER